MRLLIQICHGAHDQDRTDDLVLTKDVLYQLSYMGLPTTFLILMRETAENNPIIIPPSKGLKVFQLSLFLP